MVDPVNHITCDDCNVMYVGETARSVKTHFLEHWRKSSAGSEVSHVNVHVDRSKHGVNLDKVKILTVEKSKFERGVKAIYVRVTKPSLNKDGDCYLLPAV